MCLQVLESGGSVSSSVLFEYRARNASSLPSSQLDWLSLDGQCQRPLTLVRRPSQGGGHVSVFPFTLSSWTHDIQPETS